MGGAEGVEVGGGISKAGAEQNKCPGVRWRTGVKIPAPFPLIAWVPPALLISSLFPTCLSPQVPTPAGPSIFYRAIDLGLIFIFINTKISVEIKCQML